VRPDTLRLVTCLDFRGFAIGSSDFFSHTSGRRIADTFRDLPSLFPDLRCIQLDGHRELDPGPLAKPRDAKVLSASDFQPPRLLSVSWCQVQLPASFFDADYLRQLVYLDISDVPGSLKSTLSPGSLRPSNLPALRILKARGREVDDFTAMRLFMTFTKRLWSLDLSCNSLTDDMITTMVSQCFPAEPLQSDSHFDSEGRIRAPGDVGSDNYGRFKFIEESACSAAFSHPGRYLVDTPIYYADSNRPPQDAAKVRVDGRASLLLDTADAVKRALAGGIGSHAADILDVNNHEICRDRAAGLTHLHLNQNNITSSGLDRLLRLSQGHLEHLECDSVLFQSDLANLPHWLPRSTQVHGLLGVSHLFRPVMSSNLRSLRVHHSLVTLVPTLLAQDVSTMTRLWLSEEFLYPSAEMTHPQAFIPDMNPRVQILSLTNLPRYSTGPLIDRLIAFLKLAWQQEEDIKRVPVSSRRSPPTLRGLRHIRLEFEPDPSEELEDLAGTEEFDAGEIMNSATDTFSFFGDAAWRSSRPDVPPSKPIPAEEQPQPPHYSPPANAAASAEAPPDDQGDKIRFSFPPFTESMEEYIDFTSTYNGTSFTVPVYIGPGVPVSSKAINAYMQNLSSAPLRAEIRPVTPSQVVAGVPAGSYVFNRAWDAMFGFPPARGRSVAKPSREELARMKDVVAEIRKYRAGTKVQYEIARRSGSKVVRSGGDGHWTGTLELVIKSSLARYDDASYWR